MLGCFGSCARAPDRIPEEVLRHNALGAAFLSQSEWAKAEAEFRAALAVRRDDPVLLVNLALSLLQQQKREEAEALLEKAVAGDPGSSHARYNLGLIERDRGEFARAAERFRAVAAADPRDSTTQVQLGSVLTRLDRPDEAEKAFRAALALNPEHVSALYGLGRVLIQTGRAEEGAGWIDRSQKIRARSGIDEAMGPQYGEQGPYAVAADYPAGGLEAPDPIAVVFQQVADPFFEGGVASPWALLRLSTDARPVVLVARPSGVEALEIGRPPREVASTPPWIRSLATGDVDGNGHVEVLAAGVKGGAAGTVLEVLRLDRDGSGGLSLSPRAVVGGHLVEIPGPPSALAQALVDADHDGDLDLFVCWSGLAAPFPAAKEPPSRCRLATNDGSGFFTIGPGSLGLVLGGDTAGPIALTFSDVDNDRDIDLLAADPDGVHLFANQRDGTFRDASTTFGLGSRTGGIGAIAVADLDKDGFMDLVLSSAAGTSIAWNRRGVFEAPTLLEGVASREGVVVLDYDNDGFLDIACAGARSLALLRGTGLGRFARAKESVPGAVLSPLAAFDADADGDLDLAVREGSGAVALLRNDGGNAGRSITLHPEGVRDNRSGIGAKVEILAGALRQKFEVTSPFPIHAGLGSRGRADAVRIVWPQGVLQDEIDVPPGSTTIAQLDRKGTSCPLLYAWRDGRWRFVTDFLGGCAIGYRHAPGALNLPDTDEHVRIDGGIEADGADLRLRINNQLEEVIWLDQAELVLVDHPAGTEVYPDEQLMPGPPWPGFRLFASDSLCAVRAAQEVASGRDVTPILGERDRRTVGGFAFLPYKGYAEPHSLELDLGAIRAGERTILLLDGWIDYADSSANIAASQAGVSLTPPRLLVPGRAGAWREVPRRMGFPAGLPKTMTVDLTGFVSPTDPRIRIETNMRIHWDRARVLLGGEETPLKLTRLKPRRAELRFGGYPAEASPDGRPPFGYDPDRVNRSSPFKVHAGAYTAFGDVTGLLASTDDRFVTTRGGDEIELWFDSSTLPPPGWTRTYLLYADGFGKDMDPNSAANAEVSPIPFHGMPVYPYGSEVSPPVVQASDGDAVRIVPFAADGLTGARPLALSLEDR